MRHPWNLRDRQQRRLMRKATRGDREAFRKLYMELHPIVNGYIYRRVRIAADTQDLTARVFHRMLERLEGYDEDRGSVRTWVLGIARNAVIDHVRSGRIAGLVDSTAPVADPALPPDEAVVRDEQARLVRDLLTSYPAEVHEMFALRFGDGLRYREIAELIGSTETAVKQRFSRILRELRARTRELEKAGATHYAT